jgi:hypothetical protein
MLQICKEKSQVCFLVIWKIRNQVGKQSRARYKIVLCDWGCEQSLIVMLENLFKKMVN